MSGIIDQLLDPIEIPKMVKVKQKFNDQKIDKVIEVIREKIIQSSLLQRIKPGQSVAITGGSRGITKLPEILKEIIDAVKEVGADPFIVPAMGSHGGATAAGQKDLLKGMGISEETVGAPIKAAMDVVKIGQSDNGLSVYLDKYAYQADAIVLVNRIKPHVAFRGKYESGLIKMITIGLGKQQGADICHNRGFGKMAENIPSIAHTTLQKANIIFGVGIIENAYDQPQKVVILPAEEIEAKEPQLLKEAKASTAELLFHNFDALIMDEIGKDISGSGLDTNVVGRYHTPFADDGTGPNIRKMGILNLTDKSYGNANGVGIVDYTTQRVFNKMDFEQTYANSLTSTVADSIKVPMVLKNDRQVFQACIKCCNITNKKEARIVRIKSTLDLDEIEISETLLEEAKNNPRIEILSEAYDLPFDKDGNLL